MRIGRGAALAERSRLPALRRRGAHLQDAGQEHPDRPLQVLPVPQALPRDGRDHLRGQPHPAAHLVAGDCAHVLIKKGISSNQLHRTLGIGSEDRLVHVAPHPRGDARRRACPDGRRRIVEADETYLWKTRSSAAVTSSAAAVPSPRAARAARPTSVRSSRLSSAAARSAPSMSRTPTRRPSAIIVAENIAKEARCIPTKAASTAMLAAWSPSHETVKHSAGEYVRYEDGEAIHTNSV